MQIEKKTFIHPLTEVKEVYYTNQKLGQEYREYRRIIGGIAWPYGMKSGFSLVIGEDRFEDKTLKKRHYHLLAEAENIDPIDLLKKSFELQGQYLVNFWYGDSKNEPMMEFVFEINKKRDKKIKGFYITDAPYLEDPHALEFYVDVIRQRTMGNRKTLHFMEESRLPNYLMELTSEKVPKVKHQTFPAIAALGYVVSAFNLYQPISESDKDRLNKYFIQKSVDEI